MRTPCATAVLSILLLAGGWSNALGADDPNLVGWWQLDEGAGLAAADSSGRSVDGDLFGEPIWSQDGVDGGCLLFDGTDDYIFIDGTFKLPVYTMTVWFRADMTGQRDIISAYAPGVLHGILLEQQAAGTLRFLHRFPLGQGGGNNVYSTAAYSDGEWHHAAITKSPTDIALYADGQQVGTVPDTSVFDPTDSFGVALGVLDNERALDRLWGGAMDDVRIYNRSLAADEIKALVPPKLKAYKPDPANGTIGVALAVLRWTKGETAMFHNVYLGTSPDLTADNLVMPRSVMALYFHVPGLTPGATYYWRVDEIEKDGVTIHTGDVWSFTAQDVTAYYPSPADKANTVLLSPTLTWMPGIEAIQHHVYFGDNLDAVTQGTPETDKGVLALGEETLTPGVLDSLTTYYWRVDEILTGDAVRTGPVWSFVTVLPIDDFESYTDDEGSRIYETWIDGFTNGNSGSTVGYIEAPFAEQTIVHDANQSMPFDYNNVDSPFYSEAEREFTPAEDWTADGADTLLLYVRGRVANSAAPLYVALEDAAKHVGIVAHPDTTIATSVKWTEWKIPLSSFAGVDPSRVVKMYIGVGDRENPTPGGRGRLYIDDICLARP